MDITVNRTGQEAFYSAEQQRRVVNVENDILIGIATEFDDTKEDRTVKPFAGGKFAGIVCHTDDHVYDETANTKTIKGPATVSVKQVGNIIVLAKETVKAGDQAGLNATGEFVKASTGPTKLNAYFEGNANAGEEVVVVINGLVTL